MTAPVLPPFEFPVRTGVRPELTVFVRIMEAKLRANDHKGGWSGNQPTSLLKRLKEEVTELEDEINKPTISATRAAFEAVDVANFAMMIVDVLTGGKMATLPRNLSQLTATPTHRDSDRAKMRVWQWSLVSTDPNGPSFSGRVLALEDDAAMLRVRDAAIADNIARPFEVSISRVFRIVDETVQRTAEVEP